MDLENYVSLAQNFSWPNVKILGVIDGTLYIRYTKIGAALIIIKNGSDANETLNNIECYESDIFQEPHRIVNENHILDLFYFADYSIIDSKDSKKICFHDTVQEFGININFQTSKEITDLNDKMHTLLTIEQLGLPGCFKITRFRPPFGIVLKKNQRLSFSSVNVITNDIINEITLFQQLITPKNNKPNKEKLSSVSSNRKELISKLNEFYVDDNDLLDTWLVLLNLPKSNEFNGKILENYMNTKNQWYGYTCSQLNRSNEHIETINLITNILLAKAFPKELCEGNDLIRNIAFSVLLTFFQIDFKYNEIMSYFNDILAVILYVMAPMKDGENVVLKNGVKVSTIQAEAIAFWILLSFSIYGEHFRIFDPKTGNPTNEFSLVNSCLMKVNKILLQVLMSFDSFGKASDSICSFFSDFIIEFDKAALLWTNALISGGFHEFFICVFIVCIVFNFKIIVNNFQKGEIDWKKLLKNTIEEYGISFICDASFNLMRLTRNDKDLKSNSK